MKMLRSGLLFVLTPLLLQAQTATPTATPGGGRTQGVWRAEMPAGTYIVALSAITTVSKHEYIVDGTARVTEVSVGTLGMVQARFYFIEPNIPQTPNGIGQSAVNLVVEKAKQATERAGVDELVWQKVVKNYPTTTHAHTVEYRLATKDSLNKLFESLENAWTRGRGDSFKP